MSEIPTPQPTPAPIRRPSGVDHGTAPTVHGSPWLVDHRPEHPGKPESEATERESEHFSP